jgi:hypothetical protein
MDGEIYMEVVAADFKVQFQHLNRWTQTRLIEAHIIGTFLLISVNILSTRP